MGTEINTPLDIITLLTLADLLARKKRGGHLTIMRFTTHWKAMIGTPNLDCGDGRSEVRRLKGYDTLEEALKGLLIKE